MKLKIVLFASAWALVLGFTPAAFAAAPKTAKPAAAVSLTPPASSGSTIAVSADHGKTEFHAVGRPSMIKINGEGKAPAGDLKIDGTHVTGDLTLDMTSLSSGISMRDEHMKEKYLEVGKFPTAKLHLTDVTVAAPLAPVTGAKFKGDLTLHGVTKPVEGTFDLAKAGDLWTAKAAFTVDISNYGVVIPTYLGITVKNDVPIELTMTDLKAK